MRAGRGDCWLVVVGVLEGAGAVAALTPGSVLCVLAAAEVLAAA